MWNNDKSIKLTHFVVRVFYLLLFLVSVIAPWFMNNVFSSVRNISDELIKDILVTYYFAVPAGLIALICLDKLLINIKKSIVFDYRNIRNLRILSWCCFYVALICAISSFLYIPFFIVCVAALFTGLVVRVIKNIFYSAIKIKEENELTI